ncbi:hypothetical protein [Oceanobacillus profundus]|uniref:phage tail assembly chaperone G n=1 Tax=Oceanobacillus TaxID=182709 RepID=UPI00204104CD|nr:hypothetical protein [Oceanobacillus profundus]MCM3396783.1 hypothetical protein [Oceanobacillus profundus]MDO6448085.1 hypothetical protein [Oceanobacillus profundus]
MSKNGQEERKAFSILLEIDDKDKRFVTPKKIPGVLWRQAAMVGEELESGQMVIADLDSHMQFVCDVFGNQFTLDEFENGIDSRDLIKTIYSTTLFVMGQVSLAAEMLTKDIDISDVVQEINEKKT